MGARRSTRKSTVGADRIRRLGVAALLVAILALAASPAAASAGSGYRIEQRSGETRTVITLSSQGARYELLQPPRRGGKVLSKHAEVLVATIIEYPNAKELLLDPAQRLFQEIPLAGAISGYEHEVALLSKAGPTIQVPAISASGKKSSPTRLKLPRAHVKGLGGTTQIGPVTARAYLLHQGTVKERIWYSSALPLPPEKIRSVFARAVSRSSAVSTGALGAQADEIPLRIEEAHGKHWRVVLRTTRLASVSPPASEFTAPHGYERTTKLDTRTNSTAHAADVPADPLRCAFVVTCIGGGLLSPIESNPGVWADYWGPHWSQHLDLVSAINHGLEDDSGDEFADGAARAFWEPLGQYGIEKGKLLGYEIVSSSPGREVGANGILEVVWFVLSHRWGTNAPKYWWRFWGESPLFAIFVDESEVNSSGWAGYHAFAPTEGLLFWWLAHPAMPFFVIKVPSLTALGNQHSGTSAWRETLDAATERASHEYVETVTDPYPFTAWADPTKEPVWEDGELADICEEGNSAPWGKETRITETAFGDGIAVDPYWSNEAQACVPEARPKLAITYPAANSTVYWREDATFVAEAKDLWEGSPVPEYKIRWIDEGHGLIGTGAVFSTTGLSPGVHHVYVEESDVTGGYTKTAAVTVNVVARAPTVKIEQPLNGETFPDNHLIAFRGTATDPSEGNVAAHAIWSVDGAKVGTGASLLLYRIGKEGEHTVTLSVTNEAGLSASSSIHLTLGPPVEEASVHITSPINDYYDMNPEEKIQFTAEGEGYGGETLTSKDYKWTDIPEGGSERVLGEGPSLLTALGGPGCEIVDHHVTVTVKDGTGHEAHETIEVTVGDIC